jgi:hypothetical protein
MSCNNFISSGDLVMALAENGGEYAVEKDGDTLYYAFNDRRVVSFVSNAFPESMF